MKYYIIHNQTEIYIAENPNAFANLGYTEEVHELPDDYTSEKYIVIDGELVLNPNYDDEQTEKRKQEFESQFLATSKGNYRLVPQGYANAQQSIDTINGNVLSLGELDAEIAAMVIFYPTPDFTKPEQCTEEWLIEHQYNIETMTKEAWGVFYREFSKLYALKQYKKQLEMQ